jgi:hypothetical protein
MRILLAFLAILLAPAAFAQKTEQAVFAGGCF